MATPGPRPPGRVPVSFDADVWSQEVERLRARSPMRAAAERARNDIAAQGVPRTALWACSAEGDDGTRLARCLKVYVPLNDRPASERPYAFVFELAISADGGVTLRPIAYGERHPEPADVQRLRARPQALARPLPRPVAGLRSDGRRRRVHIIDRRQDAGTIDNCSDLSYGRGGFRTCDLSRVKRALSH